MGTCPKCGSKIEYLLCYAKEDNTYCFDGKYYVASDYYTSEMEFVCPECKEIVTRDEEEAEALLKK